MCSVCSDASASARARPRNCVLAPWCILVKFLLFGLIFICINNCVFFFSPSSRRLVIVFIRIDATLAFLFLSLLCSKTFIQYSSPPLLSSLLSSFHCLFYSNCICALCAYSVLSAQAPDCHLVFAIAIHIHTKCPYFSPLSFFARFVCYFLLSLLVDMFPIFPFEFATVASAYRMTASRQFASTHTHTLYSLVSAHPTVPARLAESRRAHRYCVASPETVSSGIRINIKSKQWSTCVCFYSFHILFRYILARMNASYLWTCLFWFIAYYSLYYYVIMIKVQICPAISICQFVR